MKKLILSVALIATTIVEIVAQNPVQNFNNHPREFYQQKMFWFEGNFSGTLSQYKTGADSGAAKWSYQMDYQYRRQADASFIKNGNYDDIFKQMYQTVLRPWIHYWAIPKKLRLSISPLGYWGTWTPIAEAPATKGTMELNGVNNGIAPIFYHEYRTSLQVTLFNNLGKRWEFGTRYRFEFRWVGKNQNSISPDPDSFLPTQDIFTNYPSTFTSASAQYRIRIQQSVRFNLAKDRSKYIIAWDELFLSVGPQVGSATPPAATGNTTLSPNNKIFNQNRIICLYGQKFNSARYPVELQVGITYVMAPKLNYNVPPTQTAAYGTFDKANVQNILALQVYLILPEFHKFKKRDNTAQIPEGRATH